jgi:signal transduction histidine kinase
MYRLTLVASFLSLLAATLLCAALAVWGAGVSTREIERTRAAHEVLDRHFEIDGAFNRVFRMLTEHMLLDDAASVDVEAAETLLRRLFDGARAGIAYEVRLLGDDEDETDELQRLAAMERAVGAAFRQMRALERAVAAGAPRERTAPIAAELDRIVDVELRGLMEAALAEERREVADAHAASAAALQRSRRLAFAAAGAATLFGAAGLVVLLRRLQRPLRRMDAVAERIAAGDLSLRVPDLGHDEFGAVGRSLNRMLDALAASRSAVDAERARLGDLAARRAGDLEAANAALRRADEVRRRFLADISHELRTPLTIIRGEAEVTLRANSADLADYRTALERVADQSALTARLVDDLLFVSRVEAREPRMKREAVAFTAVVRQACADAENAAQRRAVRIAFSAPAGDQAVVGDADRLRQLVAILLDNAIGYSPEGGLVEVRVSHGPSGVLLTVSDQGVGVAEADLPRVFERFHRGDNAVALKPGGSGLGLAMARSIIEAHGGAIELVSRLGEGATVTATLPAGAAIRSVA